MHANFLQIACSSEVAAFLWHDFHTGMQNSTSIILLTIILLTVILLTWC